MIPSTGTFTRIHGLRLAMTSLAATGLAVAAAIAISSGASAADPLKVQVGAGAGQISANAYLPGKVTVEAGSSVTFAVTSDEPHSVTFGTGPADLPPGSMARERLVRAGRPEWHTHRSGGRQLRRQRLRQHGHHLEGLDRDGDLPDRRLVHLRVRDPSRHVG